jgi:hypothetical protein
MEISALFTKLTQAVSAGKKSPAKIGKAEDECRFICSADSLSWTGTSGEVGMIEEQIIRILAQKVKIICDGFSEAEIKALVETLARADTPFLLELARILASIVNSSVVIPRWPYFNCEPVFWRASSRYGRLYMQIIKELLPFLEVVEKPPYIAASVAAAPKEPIDIEAMQRELEFLRSEVARLRGN